MGVAFYGFGAGGGGPNDRRRRKKLAGSGVFFFRKLWNKDSRKRDFQRFEGHLRHIYGIQFHESLLIVLIRKGISNRDNNKNFNKVANVTELFAGGSTFKEGYELIYAKIYWYMQYIIRKCFTAEELDNLLFMIFTYRNIQNGGKIIWGDTPLLRGPWFLRPRLTGSV